MGNRSIRIRTTPGGGDKYLKIKLEQDVDQFEILSLKISQKDLYGSFNADFGVLIGRVIANGGVGIPNAKISIFIPISDDDKLNSNILSVYPYTTPRDKNLDGVRYNLLPRVSVNNPFLVSGDYAPKVPVGTFPTKEEITTNQTYIEVFEKYYKYTTISNTSGDYMIYGVPVGNQTVHMSVDITDIGKYSMNPATMIQNLGYSPNLFTDNGTKIKFSTDLETLPNIETQEIAVEIRPFWGDVENFEIGITRQDFKVRALLSTSFVVFGSAFTDGQRGTWGQNDHDSGDNTFEFWRLNNDGNINLGISSKRIGTISTSIYYIPNTISDADANSGNFSTTDNVIQLTPDEYVSYVDKGEFVYILTCNRKKIITDEFGKDVEVEPSNSNGVFTEFRGMFFCSYGEGELSLPGFGDISGGKFEDHTFYGQRWKMKIPQYSPTDDPNSESFTYAVFNDPHNKYNQGTDPVKEAYNEIWRKQHFVFSAATYYSVAKYHPLSYRDSGSATLYDLTGVSIDGFWSTGIIVVNGGGNLDDANPTFEFPQNIPNVNGSFGAEWMNFCLYFPQHTFFFRNPANDFRTHSNDNVVDEDSGGGGEYRMYSVNDNTLIGKEKSTSLYLRNDFHKTLFIKVPKEDVINILDKTLNTTSKKGFKIDISNPVFSDAPYNTSPLIGDDYKGKSNLKYFYKGFDSADCITFLNAFGLV